MVLRWELISSFYFILKNTFIGKYVYNQCLLHWHHLCRCLVFHSQVNIKNSSLSFFYQIFYQSWKVHITSPQQMFTTKEACFQKWTNNELILQSQLGSFMRRKIERKKSGVKNSAFTPLSLPVHSGSHYIKLQNNMGTSSSLSPTSSRSHWNFLIGNQHILMVM